ncbi:MAG: CRTAC1 family protein [Capsulimonadales bacterium]|nr:CRTAC1 family protein [Capsulimonadales bacterium]
MFRLSRSERRFLWPMAPLLLAGCLSSPKSETSVPVPSVPVPSGQAVTPEVAPPRFTDVTEKAGIRWKYDPCRTGRKYLPETVGGGGGFLDYNNDGLLDILLINGRPLDGGKPTGPLPRHALYENKGDGTFRDVTEKAGLTTSDYGMGAAVGDYDNDGWPDIYLTVVGKTRLFRNEKGHFTDVTARAKVAVDGFTTAAAWGDTDRDGDLDLLVSRYVEWTPATDLPCGPVNARQYCAPHQYTGAPPVFFRNNGNGTFTEASKASGVLGHPSKTLAIAPFDFNGDGWLDFFLANDTEPDVLLLNRKDGTFRDAALEAGIAVGADGTPTGSMGVDVDTPFGDGRSTVAIGVFAGQQMSLFVVGETAGDVPLFDNRKQDAGVAMPTATMTTFGLAYADVNNDSHPDVLIANGHIDDDQALTVGGKPISYEQPAQLFLNRGNGTFEEIGAGAGLTTKTIGRGLAVGDYDNDGKADVLLLTNEGAPHLFRNETVTNSNWLGLKLVGKKGPRDATGALVTLIGNRGARQTRCVTTVRSYLSCNDSRLLFGIPAGGFKEIEVRWPSGKTTVLRPSERNRYITITEEP